MTRISQYSLSNKSNFLRKLIQRLIKENIWLPPIPHFQYQMWSKHHVLNMKSKKKTLCFVSSYPHFSTIKKTFIIMVTGHRCPWTLASLRLSAITFTSTKLFIVPMFIFRSLFVNTSEANSTVSSLILYWWILVWFLVSLKKGKDRFAHDIVICRECRSYLSLTFLVDVLFLLSWSSSWLGILLLFYVYLKPIHTWYT